MKHTMSAKGLAKSCRRTSRWTSEPKKPSRKYRLLTEIRISHERSDNHELGLNIAIAGDMDSQMYKSITEDLSTD